MDDEHQLDAADEGLLLLPGNPVVLGLSAGLEQHQQRGPAGVETAALPLKQPRRICSELADLPHAS
jgi:hypothetical protein